MTHLPTGTVVSIQDERSQHRNKAKALELLRQRVLGARAAAAAAARSEIRGKLAGSGERAERIRTYNAPHDRVTDHRCSLTAPGVPRVLSGEGLEDIVEALARMEADERLREFEASAAGS